MNADPLTYPEKDHYTADDLLAILAILRDPDNGCPWDKVQTLQKGCLFQRVRR